MQRDVVACALEGFRLGFVRLHARCFYSLAITLRRQRSPFTFEYSRTGRLRFLAWGCLKLFLLGNVIFGVLCHRGWRLEDCIASHFAWYSKKGGGILVTSWMFVSNWINLMKTITWHASSNSLVFFSPQLSLAQVSGTHLFFSSPSVNISRLAQNLKNTAAASRAPGLLRAINGLLIVGNRLQHRYCKRVVSQPLLWISHYIQHLVEETSSASAINSAFYAISWAHKLAGLEFPHQPSYRVVNKERRSKDVLTKM